MNMPKALEKNLLGVGLYDAADTALFGMLPNQELLNEKERMAAGLGSAVGMVAAIPTGMAALKGVGKLTPGLSKLMPKSMQKMFKAEKKFGGKKGIAMKGKVDDFEKFLRGKGLNPKNFTGAEGLEREAIREFLKANKTSKAKGGWTSFRKTFLDALHADKRFKYKKGKGADLSKLREDLGGAASTAKTGFYNMKDNKAFTDAIDDLIITNPKDVGQVQKLSDWIMKNGPHNMKVDFWQAKQAGDKKKMNSIINKVIRFKAWKKGGFKGSMNASSKGLGAISDDMSSIALGDDNNVGAGPPAFLAEGRPSVAELPIVIIGLLGSRRRGSPTFLPKVHLIRTISLFTSPGVIDLNASLRGKTLPPAISA